ncbi:hypothetical protein R3P38DRAFT_24231 [Favolaschia claudopus]|uniref:KN homeodomain domain-containing protein n=1 Tax=Favolaschia claudopus TaxID=2862362 RepID=A0AAW0EHJ2_9AGAR
MQLSILSRLQGIEADLYDFLAQDPSQSSLTFEEKWDQLNTDITAAVDSGILDDETKALAYNIASKGSALGELFLSLQTDAADITDNLVVQLEGLSVDAPSSNDSQSSDSESESSPSPRSSFVPFETSLPPFIEPAYEWLLKHLHNPYPNKAVKQKIADETGSSLERISDWFFEVRRRMGWSTLLREEFERKRVEIVDAARRYHLDSGRHRDTLAVEVYEKFERMDVFAQRMRDEIPRQERLRKARVAMTYPSPPASGPSSPMSEGTSRKRSYSETSDDEREYSLSKRPRTVNDASTLPSPPSSSHPSPNLRKRRLSESDGPSAKRPRFNGTRSTSDPFPVVLSGNPEDLANWFTSNDSPDIFAPEQLLEVELFNATEFALLMPSEEEESASIRPMAQGELSFPNIFSL